MAEIAQNIEEMEQDSVVQEPDSQTTEEVQVQETKEEEQNPRIAELEKQFENRYTESDPAFKAVVESKEASPPVVQNFGSHGSDRGRDDDRYKKRSRSRSPSTLKRKGMFDCFSYFVYYY